MRFRAPRSTSPSPVRRATRSSCTFGLHSDSDSEDYLSEVESSLDTDSDDVASIEDPSSEETFELVSDINKLSIRPARIARSPQEERQIAETISAIRLRARYHDPYEEWEQKIRTDSFNAARKDFTEKQTKYSTQREQHQQKYREHQAMFASKQAAHVSAQLDQMRRQLQENEAKMKLQWKQREKDLWERVETAIKQEEEKLAKKLEEERKEREEQERKQKEEELKKKLVEEKRLKEEAEKKRLQDEKEKAEKEAQEERQKCEQEEQATWQLRQKLSINTPAEDWRCARTDLCNLKAGPLRLVKGNKPMKSEWLRLRRLLVVRIGQLTNDAEAITRITKDIIEIVRPSTAPPHPEPIYFSLLSALAKAILLQAETEVSAESHTAEPLARVAFSLVETLEHFNTIFFAKLVQRCGGWPIPLVVPPTDVDELPWDSRELYIKVSGWRKSETDEGLETTKDRVMRISALMRVYFNVIKIRPQTRPLSGMYQLPRYWVWFARLLSDKELLQDPVAPWLIYTGLDVFGLEACSVWGKQWAKVLSLIHGGVTTGMENGKLIGGDSVESGLGRARILFVLGNIVNGEKS